MSSIINIKERHIKNIEKKASEMFGAIKLGEDSYIIPSNMVNSKEVDDSFLDSELYKDEELKNEIRKLKFRDKVYVSITCKKIKKDNVKVLEFVNVIENIDSESITELAVKSNLLYEDREHLLNMIADEHRDKQVFLTFYIHYNFNLLEGLVSED